MIAYQLYTLPTNETLNYLKLVFENCPFEINWDQCYIELNLTADKRIYDAIRLDTKYSAMTSIENPLQIQYDNLTETTKLYLPLVSEKLLQIANVSRYNYKPIYHTLPLLYMVISQDYPYHRRYNTFINSISDYFASHQAMMKFEALLVQSTHVTAPNDCDFYQSYGLQ